MNRNIIKFIIWIPVIIMAGIIFGFSKQDGVKSSSVSYKVASVAVEGAERIGLADKTPEIHEKNVKKLQFPIRKLTHMTEYAMLAVFIYIALLVDGLSVRDAILLSFTLAVVFAISDEVHQLYVPGRSGRASDVFIDSSGNGIGLIFFNTIFLNKIRHLRK